MDGVIDSFVRAVAPPKGSKMVSSVRPWIVFAFCVPMVALTRATDALEVRATAMLLLNIWVRLLWPTGYYPATASQRGVHASPVTARLIAFIAEFGLYEVWAVWAGVDFWGPATYLWLMVGVGEVVSTVALFVQSEFLFLIEDTIWFIHTTYMAALSYPPRWPQLLFFGGFSLAMFAVHLPRRFKLLLSRGRSASKGKQGDSIFSVNPLFTGKGLAKIRVGANAVEFAEKAWVVPMLLGQPILVTFCYWEIHSRL